MCASVCMPPAAQEADADAHGFPPQFEFAEWQTEKRARLFSSTASGEAVDERRVRGRVDSFSTTRPSAGKDRHSKVNTSKGPRDRRVRLSVPTAVQFYEVQDRLGYDQPSKAVEWLMRKAKAAIDELAHLPMPPCPTSVSPPAQVDKHRYSQQQQAGVSLQPQLASECETPESVCGSKGDGGSGLSTRMESRAKARQRARERAKGKVGGRPALVASEAHYLQEEMSMHGLEQECLRKLQPVLTIHDYDLWQSHEERHPRHSSRLQQTSPSMRTGQRLDVAQSMCGGLSLAAACFVSAGLPAGDLTSSSWCCSPTFVNPGIGMGQPEHHVVGGPGKPPASWNDSTAFWETCVPGPNPLMMGPLQSTIPQGTRVPALRSLVKELHGSRSGDVV